MKPEKQLISDRGVGDCFRACMCSILDIPNSNDLPNVHDSEWFLKWQKFLKKFGLRLCHGSNCWKDGYWIASVPSLNYALTTHAIVMKDTKVFFDPSTKKKYKKGTEMLGCSDIMSGYWVEIDDISKINNLSEYQ